MKKCINKCKLKPCFDILLNEPPTPLSPPPPLPMLY